MMTTFSAMPMSCSRWRIIGALLLAAALAACSTLRLTYNQGPNLLYWWADGYVDFDDAQRPKVRDAIERWFRWHRATQLPDDAALLERAQSLVTQPLNADQLCALWRDVQRRADVLLGHAVPAIADLARTLTPSQLEHVERRFDKANREFRRDFLQLDPDERRRAALKRARDRAELVYGTLEPAQRDLLASAIAASPFEPERMNAERLARQRDIVQTLRAVASGPSSAAQAEAMISALGARLLHTPRAEYRAYQQRLIEYNCGLVAELHETTTAAQREHARTKLKGWEDDVRSLVGGDPR
jgi:hypothetical protein